MPLNITPWMRDELARRKQLWRDLFAGGLHNCCPNPCHAAYVAHHGSALLACKQLN